MIAFGHGTSLSDEDYDLMGPLLDIAARIFLLTTDFYSWRTKKYQNRDCIANAVFLYIKSQKIPEEKATSKVKQDILDHEARFLMISESFCTAHPDLPVHLKKLVNTIGPSLAGYHYWCATCPKYHNPTKQNIYLCENGFNKKAQGCNETPIVDTLPQCPHPVGERQQMNSTDSLTAKTVALDMSALMAPNLYIQSLPSKNFGSQIMNAVDLWLCLPSQVLNIIEQVTDGLHNSAEILDDIQDESPLRRGSASTHLVFGNAQTINSATDMVVRISKQIFAVQNLKLMTVLLEEVENLFIGQSWDLKWKFTVQCPTVGEYLAMIDLKTGAMFKMVFRFMQTATKKDLGSSVNFCPLALLLGRWYQIRDDYLNLNGAQYTQEKGFCEDLDEGKFSYPIVKCCSSDSTAREIIMHIFQRKQSTLDLESKIRILNLMQETRALQETYDLLISMQEQIKDEVGRLEVHFGERNTILRLLMKLLGDVPAPTRCLESLG